MKELIKSQYRVLWDLKRIEEKIHRLETDISRIPAEIGELEKAVKERKEALDKGREELELAEKTLRKQELELREKEDTLRKAESKMMEVKTNAEYQAAIKENQALKEEKAKLEEVVLGLLTELDERRKAFKDWEKEFKAYEATLAEEKTKLLGEKESLEKLLAQEQEKRRATSGQLETKTASLYDRLTSRSKGVPIVAVENGMCQGCNMAVRPQLYNEVIGYKLIHQCPSCGRILVPVAETPIESHISH